MAIRTKAAGAEEGVDESREEFGTTGKIRVIVADEHVLFRSGLRVLLEESGDMAVTAEAGAGEEVLAGVSAADDIDIVLLDLAMPDGNGLDVLRRLKNRKPDLPVLILTAFPEEEFAVRSLRIGASGYITKKEAPHKLLAAIRKVIEGGRYISPALGERLAAELYGKAEKLPHETLSGREYQVMCMLASGETLGGIAEGLGLSINTVRSYRVRILDKLKLRKNAELIRYAVRHRLVD